MPCHNGHGLPQECSAIPFCSVVLSNVLYTVLQPLLDLVCVAAVRHVCSCCRLVQHCAAVLCLRRFARCRGCAAALPMALPETVPQARLDPFSVVLFCTPYCKDGVALFCVRHPTHCWMCVCSCFWMCVCSCCRSLRPCFPVPLAPRHARLMPCGRDGKQRDHTLVALIWQASSFRGLAPCAAALIVPYCCSNTRIYIRLRCMCVFMKLVCYGVRV